MAFVTLRPQAQSKWKGNDGEFETELKKFARTKLPGFACPEWVRIVDELPVSHFVKRTRKEPSLSPHRKHQRERY
jgi:acyl-coenzyme A synthetase/AMP-(fatty) acid ligase